LIDLLGWLLAWLLDLFMCEWFCFVLGVLGVLLGWFIALVALFIEFAG
jgi:hypothetical protein